MNLFWEKGFFNASIEDITHVTGFNRAAIYKNFGGKDGLFLAMLKRFKSQITNEATIPLQRAGSGIEGIKTFFTQFLVLYETANLSLRGCFLISTASDVNAHDKKIAAFLQDFLEDFRELFRNQLQYAKESGVLNANININTIADFLVGNLFGLMTLCRSAAPKKVFENHIAGVEAFLAGISTM
jgi:TetR/AcrR family transcriptional repressor of nem operon